MVATLNTAQLQQYLDAVGQWRQLRGDAVTEVTAIPSVAPTESPEAVEGTSSSKSAVLVQSVGGFFQAAHWQPEASSTAVSVSQPSPVEVEAENTPAWSFDDEPETMPEPEVTQAPETRVSVSQPSPAPIVGTVGNFFASTRWTPRPVNAEDGTLSNAAPVPSALPVNLSGQGSSPHLVGTVQHFFTEAHWH